ncbi:MAG: SusC/RagA family TonB-linked outer membrane protein [Bacteroidota bacterium]
MKTNLQKILVRVSKICLYGMVIQISIYTLAFAADGEAQPKSVDDIGITLSVAQPSHLGDIIHDIEQSTDFRFSYIDRKIDGLSVALTDQSTSLGNLLRSISRQAEVSFKRIDETIYVKKARKKDEPIIEILEQNQVSGTVLDEGGEPLPGATVLERGTSNGVVTNERGAFRLAVATDATLVISFLGYATQEIPVGGQTNITVELEPNVGQLSEVVVTALGIEKDGRTLGYATSNVDKEELTVNRTPKFVDALQGKVAGVNIQQLGAGPQGSTKIRIRGVSSFGGNNQPLIVVNGVPIDNSNFGVARGGNIQGNVASNNNMDTGDGLNSINPDDITSMTILKGGAAAALYGARAKDGVIMITTKNRAEGQGLEVKYNLNFTFGTPIDNRDYQYEYGQGEQGVRPTTPFPTSGVWSFGERMGGTHTLFDNPNVPYEAQRDHVKDFYDVDTNLTNTVTVSTGGENGGMSLSLSDFTSEGVLPGNKFNRRTVNLGFTQKNDRLTVSGNINYAKENTKNPPNIGEQDFSAVVIYTLANSIPLDVLREGAFDELGNENPWSRFRNRTNPYFALSRFNEIDRDRIFGNVTARYDITDWLYIQGRVGQDFWSREQEVNIPNGTQSKPAAPPGFVNGEFVSDLRRFRELNTDFLIGFDKSFGDFGVVANFGGNHMFQRNAINTERGRNFFQRDLYTIGNASQVVPNYIQLERSVNSLYGSAEVSYRGIFYLNGTLRNDWFSTLSEQERSIMYPSVTGTWVFSDSFSGMPDWVSFGKVRFAYSEVGSDTDVPPYADQLFYQVNPLLFNNNPVGAIQGGTIPNPNLRPMRVVERELGVEATFFNNLEVEVSGYIKTSQDQILNRQVSNASGYNNQNVNVGESENRGIEMLVSYSPIRTNDFEWRASVNATFNESEVISLGSDVEGESITVGSSFFHGELRQVVGQPMAMLYGWGWLRDDQGRIVHDAAGRGLRGPEQLPWGSALPTSWGGITNTFTYKGVRLSFLIDWKLGHKMISGTHVNAYRHGLDRATLPGRDVGFVVGEGVNQQGEINTVQTPVQEFYETIRGRRLAEISVFDAGSWQLRQITLGYNFSSLLPASLFVKGATLSLIANNVAVLWQDVPHIHPDQNGIISDRQAGLEATGVPITRDFGFNLNLTF